MAIVKTIDVVMRSHTEQFDAGIKKGIGTMERFSSKAASMAAGLGSAVPGVGQFSGLLAGLGPAGMGAAAGLGVATVAISKLSDMAAEGMERIDTARMAAERLTMLTSEFQKLEYAASFSDVATDKLSGGLQKMSKNISEAASGTGDSAKAFRELGIDADKLARTSPSEAFITLADAIDKVQNPFDKLRLASDIFGKSVGPELINVFKGGREALEAFAKEAEKFNIPVTEAEAKLIDQAKDSTDRLTKAWEGFGNTLAVKAAPLLTEITDKLTEIVSANSGGNKFMRDIGIFLAGPLASPLMLTSPEDTSSKVKDQPKAIGTAHGEMVKRQKELEEYQKMVAKSEKTISDGLKKREQEQKSSIDKINAWQEQATKTLDPALAAQQEYIDKVKEINKLYDQQFITLGRRNELLQTAATLQHQEAQEQMKKRQEEMAHRQEQMRSVAMEFLGDREKDLKDFVDKAFQRPTEPPAALELGTAAAFSAFNKNKDNQQRSDETKMARDQLDHISRIRRLLEKERIVLKMAQF